MLTILRSIDQNSSLAPGDLSETQSTSLGPDGWLLSGMLFGAARSAVLVLHPVRDGEKGIGHTTMDPMTCQINPATLVTMMRIDGFVGHLQLDVPIHQDTVAEGTSSDELRNGRSLLILRYQFGNVTIIKSVSCEKESADENNGE